MKKSSFSFGKNWKKYLRRSYSEERLATARKWLLDFLDMPDLKGRIFLDIGCGSGIHSLAAWEAGARRVISIDIDPDSIEAVATLKRSRGDPGNWEIRQGSILDDSLAENVPSADIVYSWGVLHHTGSLWKAIANSAKFLEPGSFFYIAIYVKNSRSDHWTAVKQKYIHSGWWGCRMMELRYIARQFFWRPYPKRIFKSLRYMITYQSKRGMSFMTDIRDWLGGWPYEPATAEEVTRFCQEGLGLQKIRMRTGEENIEYLFLRPAAGT